MRVGMYDIFLYTRVHSNVVHDQAGETMWIPYGRIVWMLSLSYTEAVYIPIMSDNIYKNVPQNVRREIRAWNIALIEGDSVETSLPQEDEDLRRWFGSQA